MKNKKNQDKIKFIGGESLTCDIKGAVGCFIKFPKDLASYFIINNENIKIYKLTEKNDEALDAVDYTLFIRELQQPNIYFKYFYEDAVNSSENNFKDELSNINNVSKILENITDKYTTFKSFNKSYGFKIVINENAAVEIKKDDRTFNVKTLYIILTQKFGKDISNERQSYDGLLLLKNISPVLAKLHENNIVHGDIKPENIVYDKNSTSDIKFKLIDFSPSGSSVGSPLYMLPKRLELYSNIYTIFNSYYEDFEEGWKTFGIYNLFKISTLYINNIDGNIENDKDISHDTDLLKIKSDDYAVAVTLIRYTERDKLKYVLPHIILLLYKEPYFLRKDIEVKIQKFENSEILLNEVFWELPSDQVYTQYLSSQTGGNKYIKTNIKKYIESKYRIIYKSGRKQFVKIKNQYIAISELN